MVLWDSLGYKCSSNDIIPSTLFSEAGKETKPDVQLWDVFVYDFKFVF